MKFNFPQTIFVGLNSAGEQLDHILSEVDEIEQLGPELDAALDNPATANHIRRQIEMEVLDLLHSCETFFRILANDMGMDYVAKLQADMLDKNIRRGYYEGIEAVQ